MAAFDRLSLDMQWAIRGRVAQRKYKHEVYDRLVANNLERAKDLVKRLHTVLLIGDRPAPSWATDTKYHFTPFGAHKNSSLWLNLQLEQAKIKEDSMIWINAYDYLGQPSNAIWLTLGFRKIIVLGGNAEKWVKKSGLDVKYEKVHHPQAWKRFNGDKPYPLLELLK